MKKIIGFTLIEVLLTIVILGILSTLATSAYQNYLTKARVIDACVEVLKRGDFVPSKLNLGE